MALWLPSLIVFFSSRFPLCPLSPGLPIVECQFRLLSESFPIHELHPRSKDGGGSHPHTCFQRHTSFLPLFFSSLLQLFPCNLATLPIHKDRFISQNKKHLSCLQLIGSLAFLCVQQCVCVCVCVCFQQMSS